MDWWEELKKILIGGLPKTMDSPSTAGASVYYPAGLLGAQYAEKFIPQEPYRDISGPQNVTISSQTMLMLGIGVIAVIGVILLVK